MSNLQLSSLYQLTATRFRLLSREPEAIFWIFIFPILLLLPLLLLLLSTLIWDHLKNSRLKPINI